MFETAQLKLPKEFHMQFEFKHQSLPAYAGKQIAVYLGFFFNRSKKKPQQKYLQKPDKTILEEIFQKRDQWHTVDIEVSIPDFDKPKMREITYSINEKVYWQARSTIRSRDIIPVGVMNTAVLMRNFQYIDLAQAN
ncbi:MAG: hypothetical protein HRU15_02120 [Planctomycetes bacterium]|nr:hypothetical protein [Planctomycetota bacterium]